MLRGAPNEWSEHALEAFALLFFPHLSFNHPSILPVTPTFLFPLESCLQLIPPSCSQRELTSLFCWTEPTFDPLSRYLSPPSHPTKHIPFRRTHSFLLHNMTRVNLDGLQSFYALSNARQIPLLGLGVYLIEPGKATEDAILWALQARTMASACISPPRKRSE